MTDERTRAGADMRLARAVPPHASLTPAVRAEIPLGGVSVLQRVSTSRTSPFTVEGGTTKCQ